MLWDNLFTSETGLMKIKSLFGRSATKDSATQAYSKNPHIQSTMQQVTHIQPQRLREMISQGDKPVLLDVRPHYEFTTNDRFKGLRSEKLHISREFLEFDAYEKMTNKKAWIVVISTNGIRGGLASYTLKQMGYTNVSNLLGGLSSWKRYKVTLESRQSYTTSRLT